MVKLPRFARRPWWRLAGLAALFCSACGKGRVETFPVTGQVLVAGWPAARATVTLHPVQPTSAEPYRPTAKVDEQGHFKVTTFQEGDGAPAGEYRVTVVWYVATRPSPTEDPVPRNYLPARYGQAETSPLRVTVNKGHNALEPFRLEVR